MSTAPVSIKFKWGLSASDPEQKPVLFVGQGAHLSALSWQDVRCKLEPKVTEEVSITLNIKEKPLDYTQ